MSKRRRGAAPCIRRSQAEEDKYIDKLDALNNRPSWMDRYFNTLDREKASKFSREQRQRHYDDRLQDFHDGADPQIPSFKQLPLQEWRDYELDSDKTALESFLEQEHGTGGPRELDPGEIAALEANYRNVLTDREQLALKMAFAPTAIGGARVCKIFTHKGYVIEPGRWLAADEVTNIEPCNLKALVENGYLKLYPFSPGGERERRNFSSLMFEGTNTLTRIAPQIGARDAPHAGKLTQRALSKLRRRVTNPRERKKIR